MELIRYWFEFDLLPHEAWPLGISRGCGVTAFHLDDALALLREKVFQDQELPVIKKVVEDIDISTLDRGHIIPVMEVPIYRGIWFPMGYK